MLNALQMSHHYLSQLIQTFPDGIFIDATLGNGHDSFFILKDENFSGQVIAFDIQDQAIQASQKKLKNFPTERYQLFKASHARIDDLVSPTDFPVFHGAIFNLGYLPGGNHQITTQASSTLLAIQQIANRLVQGGQIILVIYAGHPQGYEEKKVLMNSLAQWSQDEFLVCHLEYLNQKNSPPSLLIIEKKIGLEISGPSIN